jgi:hypothetical protein
MADSFVRILDGNTFVVSDDRGDIEASKTAPTGLFSYDMRFLSTWVLTVNGLRLNALSTDDLQYFEARFFLVPATGTVYIDPKLSVIRERAVGDGFHEELTVLSHSDEPADLTIRIEAASDFADLFEVKDALKKLGTYDARIEDGKLILGYRREMFRRETTISASEPAEIDEHGLTFTVHVAPHGTWTTDIAVVTSMLGLGRAFTTTKYGRSNHRASPNMQSSLERWLADAPRLKCGWESLTVTYRRSLIDLAALRFSPLIAGGQSLPAAGLPWFMTMFGRDSIFTSLQALPFASELAATTLRVLGDWQGTRVDDFRDEDPGRILHEMRYGEMAAFEERPHTPYYGAVDATPLFVVLLDEYERWTGDRVLVRGLEREARAAIAWIDDYADLMGNGYIVTSDVTSGPASRIRAGRIRGIRSRMPTGGCRASPGRRASSRVTPTTQSCAPPVWRGWSGRTFHTPSGSRSRRPNSSGASTGTSGSPIVATTRLPSTRTAPRWTHWPRTTVCCCGAGSSTSPRRDRSSATSWVPGCGPAGASEPWPRAKVDTTRWATTSARSGHSTTRSSPGACGAMVSRSRPPGSPLASWTPPASSGAGYPRRSPATGGP